MSVGLLSWTYFVNDLSRSLHIRNISPENQQGCVLTNTPLFSNYSLFMFHFSFILSTNINHILFRSTLVNNFLSVGIISWGVLHLLRFKFTSTMDIFIHIVHMEHFYGPINLTEISSLLQTKKQLGWFVTLQILFPVEIFFVILGVMPLSCIYIFQKYAEIYNEKIKYCINIKSYLCKFSNEFTFLCIIGTTVKLISCLVQLET